MRYVQNYDLDKLDDDQIIVKVLLESNNSTTTVQNNNDECLGYYIIHECDRLTFGLQLVEAAKLQLKYSILSPLEAYIESSKVARRQLKKICYFIEDTSKMTDLELLLEAVKDNSGTIEYYFGLTDQFDNDEDAENYVPDDYYELSEEDITYFLNDLHMAIDNQTIFSIDFLNAYYAITDMTDKQWIMTYFLNKGTDNDKFSPILNKHNLQDKPFDHNSNETVSFVNESDAIRIENENLPYITTTYPHYDISKYKHEYRPSLRDFDLDNEVI